MNTCYCCTWFNLLAFCTLYRKCDFILLRGSLKYWFISSLCVWWKLQGFCLLPIGASGTLNSKMFFMWPDNQKFLIFQFCKVSDWDRRKKTATLRANWPQRYKIGPETSATTSSLPPFPRISPWFLVIVVFMNFHSLSPRSCSDSPPADLAEPPITNHTG